MGNYVEVLLVISACAAFSAVVGFILGVDWSRHKINQVSDELNSGKPDA